MLHNRKYNTWSALTALSLVLLVLSTSFTFAVDRHYCRGELKSFNLFGHAKTCHEQAASRTEAHSPKGCPFHSQQPTAQKEKNCCQNVPAIVLGAQDDGPTQVKVIASIAPILQAVCLAVSGLHLLFPTATDADSRSLRYAHYHFIEPAKDIYVQSQAFLC